MHHPGQLLTICLVLLVACSGEGDGAPNTHVARSSSGGSTPTGAGSGSETAGSPSGGAAAGGSSDVGGSTSTAGSAALGGGAGASGGAMPMGGSAGAGGRPFSPGPIDFRSWVLQLPIGSGTSPTTVSSVELLAGFSNAYFYVADDGGQAYMDPATGITTGGSKHCRTEMREQTPGAGNAGWASSGTNTMTVEGKVVMLGGGSVTVAQVFNSDASIPLCELEYTSRHDFSLLYEESKGGGSSTDLKTPVALGARYTFSLALSAGELSVTINGKQVYTHTPSAGVLGNKFYFKFGNYDQSSSAGTPSKTPYSIVEAYKVDVVHQ